MEPDEMIGKVAVFFTLGKILSGAPTCYDFYKGGSTGSSSALPFIAEAACGSLWFQYGMLLGDYHLIMAGVAAVLFNLIYIACFLWYTDDKLILSKQLGAGFGLVLPSYIYIMYFGGNLYQATISAGYMASVANILAYAIPAMALREVIQNKNTDNLPFGITLAALGIDLIWFLYADLIDNTYIMLPHLIGVILACAQLISFLIYVKTPIVKPLSSAPKMPTSRRSSNRGKAE